MIAERAGRERPRIRQDRETPRRIIGLREFVRMNCSGRKGGAAIGKLYDAERTVDGLAARRLTCGDALKGGREEEAKRRPLGGRAEDTRTAR